MESPESQAAVEPLLTEPERSPKNPLHNWQNSSRSAVWDSAVLILTVLCLGFVGGIIVLAGPRPKTPDPNRWDVKNFKSLITFGDSITDEQRWRYFEEHNLTAPPPGTLFPESLRSSSGGRNWARYVVQYVGSRDGGKWDPQITLYNYAVDGSWCTNEIIPLEPHQTSVREYAIPAFIADLTAIRNSTSQPYIQPALTPSNAVFVLFIGTNDLGRQAFLTDDQVRGKVLADFTECIYASFDRLYASGARTFVLFNTLPLHLNPLYANKTLNGEEKPDSPAEKCLELTSSANQIFRYQTPYEFTISNRYSDAQVALFDINSLFQHMYYNPEKYLNGTSPVNVTSYALEPENIMQKSVDSFMWFDMVHPAEQAHRVVAKEFVEVLNGRSKYAQYW